MSTLGLKTATMVINGVILLCGLLLMATGAWMLRDPDVIHIATITNYTTQYSMIRGLAVTSIVMGVVILCTSTLTILAALFELVPVLYLSSILLFITAGGQLFLSAYGYIAGFNVRHDTEQRTLQLVHRQYGVKQSLTQAWNSIQSTYKCCGAKNFSDWQSSQWKLNNTDNVPESCCTKWPNGTISNRVLCQQYAKSYIYNKGCHNEVSGLIERGVGVLAICVTILSVLQVAVSILALVTGMFLKAARSKIEPDNQATEIKTIPVIQTEKPTETTKINS